ncbi:unnamed protein product [[Candida] boidinii]|nr:unnamed protein product [[Candida] boidinii]
MFKYFKKVSSEISSDIRTSSTSLLLKEEKDGGRNENDTVVTKALLRYYKDRELAHPDWVLNGSSETASMYSRNSNSPSAAPASAPVAGSYRPDPHTASYLKPRGVYENGSDTQHNSRFQQQQPEQQQSHSQHQQQQQQQQQQQGYESQSTRRQFQSTPTQSLSNRPSVNRSHSAAFRNNRPSNDQQSNDQQLKNHQYPENQRQHREEKRQSLQSLQSQQSQSSVHSTFRPIERPNNRFGSNNNPRRHEGEYHNSGGGMNGNRSVVGSVVNGVGSTASTVVSGVGSTATNIVKNASSAFQTAVDQLQMEHL